MSPERGSWWSCTGWRPSSSLLRNGLAKEVRDSGDEQAAAAIVALRKPTVSAWLANQLVRIDPDGIHALTELCEQLNLSFVAFTTARTSGRVGPGAAPGPTQVVGVRRRR